MNGHISGIYKIEDVVTGNVYVGSANKKNGIARRWSVHLSNLKYGRFKYPSFQEAWNEGQLDRIKFEILEECPDELLEERENYFMEYCKNVGWNVVNKKPARRSKPVADTSKMKAAQSGSKNGNAKYTEEQIREIKIKMAQGVTIADLSKETGISENYLNLIKYEYKWKNVKV